MSFSKASKGISSISVWYCENLQSQNQNLLVVGKEVEQVQSENCIFLLGSGDDAFEVVVVAFQDSDVSFKLGNVLLFD